MSRISWPLAVALLTLAGPAWAGAQEEANKKAVVEFYEKALNQKDFEHWDVVQPIPDRVANSNGMF